MSSVKTIRGYAHDPASSAKCLCFAESTTSSVSRIVSRVEETALVLLNMTFLVLSVLLGSLAYMPLPRPVPVPTVPAVRSLRPAPAASRAAAGSVSMCGILAIVNSRKSADALRLQTLTLQRLVRHRGPDGSGIHVVEKHDEKGPLCSSLAHSP